MNVNIQTVLTRIPALSRRGRPAGRPIEPEGLEKAPAESGHDGLGAAVLETAASVAGLAEALADETVCEPLGVRQAHAVQAILSASRRLMRLAGELDPSLEETSQTPARLDPLHVLEDALRALKPQLDEAGVRVVAPSPASGFGVRGGRKAVVALLTALIEQAAFLAGPGGALMLEVRQDADVRITLRISSLTPMADRLAARLRPGHDLDRARQRAVRLNGALDVPTPSDAAESSLTLRLPGAGGEGAFRIATPLPTPALSALRVLVVGSEEPDRTLIRLLGSALSLGGLYMAPDIKSALPMAQDLHPDVLLLDASSPDEDVTAFLTTLDATPDLSDVRRLALLPAAPDSDLVRRLRRCGFPRILSRPLDIADLAFALQPPITDVVDP